VTRPALRLTPDERRAGVAWRRVDAPGWYEVNGGNGSPAWWADKLDFGSPAAVRRHGSLCVVVPMRADRRDGATRGGIAAPRDVYQKRYSGGDVMADERDPRVDPQPGDVLRGPRGGARRVLAVDRHGTVQWQPVDNSGRLYGSPRWGRWRTWAERAAVVSR
jgi:hypothetical protein